MRNSSETSGTNHSLGLFLRFQRNFACKFVGDTLPKAKNEQWQVAGPFDSLTIEVVDNLDGISSIEKASDQIFSGAFSDLTLFPANRSRENWPDDEFINRAVSSTSDSVENPYLVLLSITLAPPAYEFGETFEGLIEAIDKTIIALKKQQDAIELEFRELYGSDFPATKYFHTLASPDVVIISLPQNPRQLHMVHQLAERARCLQLAEIAPEDQRADGELEKSGSHANGTAMVLVTPTQGAPQGRTREGMCILLDVVMDFECEGNSWACW